VLLQAPEPGIRNSAAKALGQIGHPGAVKPLISALQSGKEPDFTSSSQVGAAEALGMIKDPQAVRPLIKALSHKNDCVREEAIKALEKIGTSEALAAIK
jgi:HEAT repeat protein